MIRVLLVDDHPLVRTGLRALLDAVDDLDVVGEAADGFEAVERVAELDPDVTLLDLSMPRLDGVQTARRLAEQGAATAVVALTSFTDHERVTEVLRAGAVGYVLKDSEPADLIAAVRQAAAGHSPIDPRVARALLPSTRTDPAGALRPREREVLALVAQGLANKQIGRALGISERTVKAHLGAVFTKIGVPDRTSAALWARDHLD